MKEKVKAIFLYVIFFVPVNLFGQWSQSYLFDELPNWYYEITKSSICFSSRDTGYIALSSNLNNNTYYLKTNNQGINWYLIDSTTNFSVHDIEFKFGVGLSYGYSDDTATLEVFTQQFNYSKIIKASGYKDLLQVNLINSNNAVFMGIDNDSNYVIGVITISNLDLNFETKTSFGKNKIKKIDFFSTIKGWYQYQNSLFYTDNLGISNELIVSDIYDFDFYSLDSGIYIASDTWNKKLYKTFNNGKNWQFVMDLYTPTKYSGAIMNSNSSINILVDWQGTSSSSTIIFIDLNFDIEKSQIIYYNYQFPIWDLYFHSKFQGYLVNNYGDIFYTLNNGGYTSFENIINDRVSASLFPNPSNNILNIGYSNDVFDDVKIITIIDLNGEIIETKIFQSQELNSLVDISKLNPGNYIINIKIGDSQFNGKFIKF